MFFTLAILLTMAVTAKAMSYEQAREQALFLADKMAYELNLTEDQYEAAYEINLDYLMGMNSYDDLYGTYWRQRNLDLSYVLLDWQYKAYAAAAYFYRPLYWSDGFWRFRVYARYPQRSFFYYGRPAFVNVYVGGHSWRYNGGRSWYRGRSWGRTMPGAPRGDAHFGMRDGYRRGDYNRGFDFARSSHDSPSFGNRTTNHGNVSFNGKHDDDDRSHFAGRTQTTRPDMQGGGFTIGKPSTDTSRGNYGFNGSRNDSQTRKPAVGNQNRVTPTAPRRGAFGERQSSTRATVNNGASGRNFSTGSSLTGQRRSMPARSFTPGTPSTRQSAPNRSSTTSSSRSGGFGGRR